jgi:DNA-binding YbaB/EbfC family protein
MAKKAHHRAPGGFPPGARPGAGMPSPQQLARQMAEMQARIDQQRAALAKATFTGTSGGGVVGAVVRGTGELVSVSLDPSVLDPSDPEMVGDLVVAAVNVALRRAQEAAASSVGLDLGGLDPGALGLGDLRGLLG